MRKEEAKMKKTTKPKPEPVTKPKAKPATSKVAKPKASRKKPNLSRMHSPLWYLAYALIEAMPNSLSDHIVQKVYEFLLDNGIPLPLEKGFVSDVKHIYAIFNAEDTCVPLPAVGEPLVEDLTPYARNRCVCPGCKERAEQERERAN